MARIEFTQHAIERFNERFVLPTVGRPWPIEAARAKLAAAAQGAALLRERTRGGEEQFWARVPIDCGQTTMDVDAVFVVKHDPGSDAYVCVTVHERVEGWRARYEREAAEVSAAGPQAPDASHGPPTAIDALSFDGMLGAPVTEAEHAKIRHMGTEAKVQTILALRAKLARERAQRETDLRAQRMAHKTQVARLQEVLVTKDRALGSVYRLGRALQADRARHSGEPTGATGAQVADMIRGARVDVDGRALALVDAQDADAERLLAESRLVETDYPPEPDDAHLKGVGAVAIDGERVEP